MSRDTSSQWPELATLLINSIRRNSFALVAAIARLCLMIYLSIISHCIAGLIDLLTEWDLALGLAIASLRSIPKCSVSLAGVIFPMSIAMSSSLTSKNGSGYN